MAAARVSEIRSRRYRQETPAPLFKTRRGQLENLPAQLSKQAIPNGETPLLQFSLHDWYMLNANANQLTADVLPTLGEVPCGKVSAATLSGQTDAMLFLTPRAAGSRQTLSNTPGKSLAVRVDTLSAKLSITPDAMARLHKALDTDFAYAPTDGALAHAGSSENGERRRAARSVLQVRAFMEAVGATPAARHGVFASVQGGLHAERRQECARQAVLDGCNGQGVCVDGLYAGESPDEREDVVRVCVQAVHDKWPRGLRAVSGGHGAPWDVLRMVGLGVDVVDSNYPFEMAQGGFATRLGQGGLSRENLRERKWERCDDAVVVGCGCFVCMGFCKGYVRHLLEVHEMMGVTLLAAHNLFDYLTWFQQMRDAIRKGEFAEFADRYEANRRG